jgi:hypothetical protein
MLANRITNVVSLNISNYIPNSISDHIGTHDHPNSIPDHFNPD